MTKNGFFKTLKLRAILFLTIICLILASAFMFTACGDDDDSESSSISYPSASKIEDDKNDDSILVKNGKFEYGAYNLNKTSFPYSSFSEWSIATDNNAQSSNVASLNKGGIVDKGYWKETIEKFFDSSSFKKILEKTEGVGTQGETSDEEYSKLIGFDFDHVFKSNNDNRVLMLNAYSDSLGGSAVKATSSSRVALEKGAYYKVSVDIYTANLKTFNPDEGANVRLVNTINGSTQQEFGIFGIKNDAWTTYTMYVQADTELDCAITLVLGLGRGNENANLIGTNVQGSAFFDNAKIEKLDSEPTITDTITVDFGGEETKVQKYDSAKTLLYDMSGALNYEGSESFTDFESTGSIPQQSYKFVSFDIDTSALDKQDIYGATVYVVDKNGKETEVKNFKYSEKPQNCKILLKNNLHEGGDQDYTIKVVKGATDGSTYLPTQGDISVGEINYITGTTDKDSGDYNETINTLVSSIADSTVSLFAGFPQDYSEPQEETYTFNVAKNVEKDTIETKPVMVDGYKGVSTNSAYISNEAGKPVDINTKVTAETPTAGLVNSKYTYSGIIIPESYLEDTTKSIQPLFIKNTNEPAYGFIGDTKTISASSYATVSLEVFVDNTAKAYIYIIDLDTMSPMVLKDQNGAEHVLALEIANTDGKWVDVNFYIATGVTAKTFRVELWNGARDSENNVNGTVFFDNINISTSASNFESERYADLLVTGTLGKLNYDQTQHFYIDKIVLYTRELTDTEKAFNKEYPDKAVEYKQNYIWAQSEYTVYAVYNTIDPVVTDPYANITEDEEETTEGCNTDSSTFWLSFSSILLIVALVVALIALILKRYLAKKKRNASDARSHYKVTSRYTAKKDNKATSTNENKVEEKEETTEEVIEEKEEPQEEVTEEVTEEKPEEEPQEEQKLDDYVYGDVQDFGEELETNEEKPEETEAPSEEVKVEEPKETETVEQPKEETPSEEVKEEPVQQEDSSEKSE